MISVNRMIQTNNFLFFILYIFIQICCIDSAFADSDSENKKFTYGFKLYQYNINHDDSVVDNPIPTAELGSFVAKKSEFTYSEVVKYIGIPVNTPRLYRAIGYLNVKKPGTYTIITSSQGSSKYGCVFVNKKLAMSSRNSPLVVTAPVYFSEPGHYEVDIRIYSLSTNSHLRDGKFKFLIKTPDSDKPQPAHKVLLLQLK